MKKIVFIMIVFFALFIVSDRIFAETEYNTALKHYSSGKYKEAMELFKECAKKKPEPSVYYYIGYALYKIGEYDEAKEYFEKAYLIDPDFSIELVGPRQKYQEEIKETKSADEQVPPSTPEEQSDIKQEPNQP
jgi:tetratricopeptide (TPR) repeat protein